MENDVTPGDHTHDYFNQNDISRIPKEGFEAFTPRAQVVEPDLERETATRATIDVIYNTACAKR